MEKRACLKSSKSLQKEGIDLQPFHVFKIEITTFKAFFSSVSYFSITDCLGSFLGIIGVSLLHFVFLSRALQEKLAELQAQKKQYQTGFWNVNTILLGGLGKTPVVDGL